MYWARLVCLVVLGAIAFWVDRRDRRHGHKHLKITDSESGPNAEQIMRQRSDRSPWKGYGG